MDSSSRTATSLPTSCRCVIAHTPPPSCLCILATNCPCIIMQQGCKEGWWGLPLWEVRWW